jgi:hypothetical protein
MARTESSERAFLLVSRNYTLECAVSYGALRASGCGTRSVARRCLSQLRVSRWGNSRRESRSTRVLTKCFHRFRRRSARLRGAGIWEYPIAVTATPCGDAPIVKADDPSEHGTSFSYRASSTETCSILNRLLRAADSSLTCRQKCPRARSSPLTESREQPRWRRSCREIRRQFVEKHRALERIRDPVSNGARPSEVGGPCEPNEYRSHSEHTDFSFLECRGRALGRFSSALRVSRRGVDAMLSNF